MSEAAEDARFLSWNRRLARAALRPFVASRLTPNHLTTLRILAGLISLALFADGDDLPRICAGLMWVISAFLDRCDGEFARMTGRSSRLGKVYDFIGDVVLNSAAFLAIGIGLHAADSSLGSKATLLGIVAAAAIAVASLAAELNERDMAQGVKTFNGAFGFDFDDAIYVIALFAWFDALEVLLIGGVIGGLTAAVVITVKVVKKDLAPFLRAENFRSDDSGGFR